MTNPTYKTFDLQAAIAGKPIVCRNGTPAEFVAYKEDAYTYKIVCFVREEFITFTKDGSFIASAVDGFDLFMAPEKKKVWINVWQDKEQQLMVLYFTEEGTHFSDINFSRGRTLLDSFTKEYDI